MKTNGLKQPTNDKLSRVFTTKIKPLSIEDLRDQLLIEGSSIGIQVKVHPDLPESELRTFLHEKPMQNTYRFNLKLLYKGKSYQELDLELFYSTWNFALPATLIQADLLYQAKDASHSSFLKDGWSYTEGVSKWVFSGGFGYVTMYPRVGFITESDEQGPHYCVDFTFSDREEMLDTGVICEQLV